MKNFFAALVVVGFFGCISNANAARTVEEAVATLGQATGGMPTLQQIYVEASRLTDESMNDLDYQFGMNYTIDPAAMMLEFVDALVGFFNPSPSGSVRDLCGGLNAHLASSTSRDEDAIRAQAATALSRQMFPNKLTSTIFRVTFSDGGTESYVFQPFSSLMPPVPGTLVRGNGVPAPAC